MRDDFQGTDGIVIQPTTTKASYRFPFTIESATGANDGRLPYGDSLASCVVKAYNSAGTDVTSLLITGTPTVTENVVSVNLKYPGTVGRYKLTFTYTTANALVDEVDFKRITVINK